MKRVECEKNPTCSVKIYRYMGQESGNGGGNVE